MPLSFNLYLLIIPIFLPYPHLYPLIQLLNSILLQYPFIFTSFFYLYISIFSTLLSSSFSSSPSLHFYLILIHPTNYPTPWSPSVSPPSTSLHVCLIPLSFLSLHFSFSMPSSFNVYLLIILTSLPQEHPYILHHPYPPVQLMEYLSFSICSSTLPSCLPHPSIILILPFFILYHFILQYLLPPLPTSLLHHHPDILTSSPSLHLSPSI